MEALLDLTFESSGHFFVLPMIKVEAAMLLARESDPCIWPYWVTQYAEEGTFDTLQERIFPWLRSRVLARFENEECYHLYGDGKATQSDWDLARELRLLGAAPYLDVLRSVTPAVYAQRFTPGREVGIFDPEGANAAALLASKAASVHFDSGDAQQDAFVRRWFSSLQFSTGERMRPVDVAIGSRLQLTDAPVRVMRGPALGGELEVPVARALPLAVMVSFDPEDSVLDSVISICAPQVRLPRAEAPRGWAAVGGSSGRVAIVAREDWSSNAGADTDAIRALADRLEREGFTVNISGATKPLHTDAADIVHVVGHAHAGTILPNIQMMRRNGTPVVVMPYLDDPQGAATWGVATTLAAVRASPEDAFRDEYFAAIAERRLYAEVPLPEPEPTPDPHVVALLALSSVVIASSADEERRARETFGYRGEVCIVPAIFAVGNGDGIDALVGSDDFAFVHTSIEPRGGALFAMLAAEQIGMRCVLTGAIGNSEYYTYLQMFAGDTAIYLPERLLSPAQIAGLYGCARIFVDASWSGYGLHRLARAAANGAALVASQAGYARAVWGAGVESVDPASIDAIAAGMQRAWEAAPVRGPHLANDAKTLLDQQAAFRGVIRAYQIASSPAVP